MSVIIWGLTIVRTFVAFAILGLLLAATDSTEERLWRFRNLGKAFYENPTTQTQAVDEFKKALDLAPKAKREQVNYALALLRASKTKEAVTGLETVQKQWPDLPHMWFNLGIVFKKDGEFEKAQAQFERMVKLAPDEPFSHHNLGVLYKQAGRADDALALSQVAVRLNGNLAAPQFQLYNLSRVLGKMDPPAELATLYALKKAQEGPAILELPAPIEIHPFKRFGAYLVGSVALLYYIIGFLPFVNRLRANEERHRHHDRVYLDDSVLRVMFGVLIAGVVPVGLFPLIGFYPWQLALALGIGRLLRVLVQAIQVSELNGKLKLIQGKQIRK